MRSSCGAHEAQEHQVPGPDADGKVGAPAGQKFRCQVHNRCVGQVRRTGVAMGSYLRSKDSVEGAKKESYRNFLKFKVLFQVNKTLE